MNAGVFGFGFVLWLLNVAFNLRKMFILTNNYRRRDFSGRECGDMKDGQGTVGTRELFFCHWSMGVLWSH